MIYILGHPAQVLTAIKGQTCYVYLYAVHLQSIHSLLYYRTIRSITGASNGQNFTSQHYLQVERSFFCMCVSLCETQGEEDGEKSERVPDPTYEQYSCVGERAELKIRGRSC